MKITLENILYDINTDNPINIAIPLDFSEKQPHVHGIPHAKAITREVPGLIGDTKRGGSCNWEQYTLTPHSHGTHTESIGHITDEKVPVNQTLYSPLILATLISVTPEEGKETIDTYYPFKEDRDFLITKKGLEEKLEESSFVKGLIIRTLPNDPEKMNRDYLLHHPPYFSNEAMEYLTMLPIDHLLVDLPSVDRMYDEGKLSNHRLFWNMPLGVKHLHPNACTHKTITELVYIPNQVPDGIYLLNLQIPNFVTDAAPSRPLLYPIKEHHP
jgi:arylformamidase